MHAWGRAEDGGGYGGRQGLQEGEHTTHGCGYGAAGRDGECAPSAATHPNATMSSLCRWRVGLYRAWAGRASRSCSGATSSTLGSGPGSSSRVDRGRIRWGPQRVWWVYTSTSAHALPYISIRGAPPICCTILLQECMTDVSHVWREHHRMPLLSRHRCPASRSHPCRPCRLMQIPSINDIPVDFRVTLLSDAPNTRAIHSSKVGHS